MVVRGSNPSQLKWIGVYDLTKGEIGSDLGKMNLGALKKEKLRYLDVLREWAKPAPPHLAEGYRKQSCPHGGDVPEKFAANGLCIFYPPPHGALPVPFSLGG